VDELATLTRCLDVAASGRAQGAFVEGEAGIGKSRLVAEALSEAQERGMTVFLGRAEELEHNRPFGALVDALGCEPGSAEPGRAALAEMLTIDTRGASADPGLQFRALDAFMNLLEAEALERPLVLALEDLHWGDQSTLLAVRSVGRRLGLVPIALFGTFRPAPRSPELERVVQGFSDEDGHHILLGPLDDDAVACIVRDALGSEPAAGLLAQARRAAGNPLFVTELVSALEQEGAVERAGDQADVRDARIPPTLRPTILRRIGFLPAEALEALRIAAILGTTFSVSDLAAVMGRSAVDLVGALEESRRAGLLREEGNRLRFRHDLIREAIYEDLPADVRAALHADAGRALAAAGADPLQVAQQFALGATKGDSEAIDWLLRGAREVTARAPAAGAELLQRARELLAPEDPRYGEVRAELVAAMVLSGQAQEAALLAGEILAGEHDPALEGPIRLTLVQALWTQGRWQEAVDEAQAGVRHPDVDDVRRARMLAESCLARLWCSDPDGARADGEEAVRIAQTTGDDVAASLAYSHLAALSGLRGDFHESVELAEQGLDSAKSDEALRRHPHLGLGIVLLDIDGLEDAERALQTGMELGERLGTAWHLPAYHTVLAMRRLWAGDWDDAIAEAEAGLALGEELGSHPMELAAQSLLATIAIRRDELSAAGEAVAKAAAILETQGPQWSMWMMARAAALLEEASNGPDAGLRALAGAWDEFDAAGVRHSQLFIGPELARLALAVGDSERASAVVDALEEIAARARAVHADAAAAHARGLVERDAPQLEVAAGKFKESGRPHESALAAEAAATELGGSGEGERALALLEEAIGTYENLGARRDLARALASVRSLGLTRGRRGARKRPETGWESLTPSEIEVARLAAEGLTNPQIGERLFISRRTVQTHLSHIFTKLGLSSRVELAAAATRRAEDQSSSSTSTSSAR
jgi:DNA-binding CsgD family transcriptional regulator